VKLGLWAGILSATILMGTLPAFAGLGEAASSVRADQAHMQGSLRTTQTQAYTVHEIQAPTGIAVREYVSTSGKVFAVAWQGPWPPNMRQILELPISTSISELCRRRGIPALGEGG
jgi:Protein of unknown function (DUF2844)